VGGGPVKTTISARQHKLVQDGAKGVAERWLGNPEDGARDGVKFRSSVKRYSGKEEKTESEATPQQRKRKRSIRAEQAATGMMGDPPATFEERAIQDWLGKMSTEDLQKLSRLTEIAKEGKETGRKIWDKVDQVIDQQVGRIDVRADKVTIINNAASTGEGSRAPYEPRQKNDHGQSVSWARRFARIKDFING